MKLKIKGTNYKVKVAEMLGNVIGLTNPEEKSIILLNYKNYDNKTEFYKTIFHELLHAYFCECGLPRYQNDEILIEWLDSNILEISEQASKIFTKLSKRK